MEPLETLRPDGPSPLGRFGRGRRVLFLTPGSVHDRRYLEPLHRAGFDLLYVHLLHGSHRFGLPGVPSVNLGYRPLEGSGFAVRLLRMLTKLPCLFRLMKAAYTFNPDIVHACWIPTAGFWAALTGFRPLFLHCFGSDVRMRARRSRGIRAVTRFTLRRADAITCDTRQTQDLLLGEYGLDPRRVHCFPFGVDRALFRPDPDRRVTVRRGLGWESGPIIIHTRPLEPFYHPETFLEAYRCASRRLPGLRALLAGGGSMLESLREGVRQAGMEGSVRFLGDIPQEDLPGYLNAADLLVSCPEDDGMSNSVLEAMACGLPVVISDLPGPKEYVRDGRNGAVCPVGDGRSFGEAVARILADPASASDISRCNRGVVADRADRGRNAERFLGLYRRLVDSLQPGRTPGSMVGAALDPDEGDVNPSTVYPLW